MKATAALCALLLATSAQAAEIKVLSQEDGVMYPALVTIKGRLNKGDEETFRQTIGTIRSGIVFLESPGGSLAVGITIGLTIRKRKLQTAVADRMTCASACAIAWLGGTPRRMGEDARIGCALLDASARADLLHRGRAHRWRRGQLELVGQISE
jgi:hypothetical protein